MVDDDNTGNNDGIFFDAEEKVEDDDEIGEEKSSDDDDNSFLLSDLAKDKWSKTAEPVAAMVIVTKIGMHHWDELIGESDELPHLP